MAFSASDLVWQFLAIVLYFCLLGLVAFFSFRKSATNTDFIIGNRSMNFWLTALAAHASDMGSWLFMGYPAVIFSQGLGEIWAGIGLVLFMFLNWKLVAPKVRTATEQYNSMTFSSFFENRLSDLSGTIRLFTALMLFVFYTIYISSAFVGMGLVLNTLFGLNYSLGVIAGILIVVPYVFFGGYRTLAWIDLFQGTFLLFVIVAVPLYILPSLGGFEAIGPAIRLKGWSHSLIPNHSFRTLAEIFFLTVGWGLGYFGQPHIVTKFMGIRNVSEIKKSQRIGMSWMTLALGGSTLVGLVGLVFFQNGLEIPAEVFVQMVKQTFPPFLTGFILCAVFAAIINATSSMVLVLSSSLSEDVYKKIVKRPTSSRELLLVCRWSILLVSGIAFLIAIAKISTVYELVFYAWSGLGSSFGPLLLFCLYSKSINKYGAWSGILTGGIVSALWPLLNHKLSIDIPPLPPAFFLSICAIWIVSKWTQNARLEEGR